MIDETKDEEYIVRCRFCGAILEKMDQEEAIMRGVNLDEVDIAYECLECLTIEVVE